MMRWIINLSLRFRLLVVGVAIGVMALGITQLRSASVDVLPEFTPPYVEIQTEALGLSASEVEQLITVPLEADLLNGVAGVDIIRSQSVPGLSSIVLVFEPGSDLFTGRQLVQERLIQAHALPHVSKPPMMLQPFSSASRVMMIGLSPKKMTPMEASVLARWVLRPRLMGVEGVANVVIWGMKDQQLQVQVDPKQLKDRGVTLSQIVRTAGNAQIVSPLSFLEASTPGTGGFVETPAQRLQVRHVFENLGTPRNLGQVPVEGTGGKLRLADVSKLVEDHQPLIGGAVVNGSDGLLLVVEKLPGADTLEVTKRVQETLGKLSPGLKGLEIDSGGFRPATFIKEATGNLTLALIIGTVLLALALVAFFMRWRTVLISLVTIPMSLVVAAYTLKLLGQSINAISFAGLAVAITIVIDDAVTSTYLVAERLRMRKANTGEESTAKLVVATFAQARGSLMFATLIALAAIVPVAIMEGRPGLFYESAVLAYVLALLASTVIALTVAPALSLMLLGRAPASAVSPRKLPHKRYDAALAKFSRRPRYAILASCACVAVGIGAFALVDTSLIPKFKDRNILVRLDAPPGTSEPKMTAIATKVSRQLKEVGGVSNVAAQVGRAVTGDQVVDVSSGEVWVTLDRNANFDKAMSAINSALDGIDGVDHDVATYTRETISDVATLDDGEDADVGQDDGLDVLTGTDRPLVVRLYGNDSAVLNRKAKEVEGLVSGVKGVVDPQIESEDVEAAVEIKVDLKKARRYGIKPGDVRRAEAILLQGIQVGSIFQEQKVFDVVVQGGAATRGSVDGIRNLIIDRPGGGHVRIDDVADVTVKSTPVVIRRDAVSRRLDVSMDVNGRSVGSVSDDIKARLKNVQFPLEHHAEVIQEATGQEVDGTRMFGFALGSLIAIFLLFQAAFRSWRLAITAFLMVPVALVGGVVAGLIDGASMSLGALIGLFAIVGLSARFSVMLIRDLQRLERDKSEKFGLALIQQGARERMTPIITTAAATAVMLIPIIILGAIPGLELLQPMAVVILGGLVTTTLAHMFVLPALYLSVGKGQNLSQDESYEPATDGAGQ